VPEGPGKADRARYATERSGAAYVGRAGAIPLREGTRPADLASLYVSPEVGASSEGHIFREACERPEPCRTPAPPRCTTPPRYGLLAAARIYDDVEPPSVSDTSLG
jgi:hypothetical protein